MLSAFAKEQIGVVQNIGVLQVFLSEAEGDIFSLNFTERAAIFSEMKERK